MRTAAVTLAWVLLAGCSRSAAELQADTLPAPGLPSAAASAGSAPPAAEPTTFHVFARWRTIQGDPDPPTPHPCDAGTIVFLCGANHVLAVENGTVVHRTDLEAGLPSGEVLERDRIDGTPYLDRMVAEVGGAWPDHAWLIFGRPLPYGRSLYRWQRGRWVYVGSADGNTPDEDSSRLALADAPPRVQKVTAHVERSDGSILIAAEMPDGTRELLRRGSAAASWEQVPLPLAVGPEALWITGDGATWVLASERLPEGDGYGANAVLLSTRAPSVVAELGDPPDEDR